MSVQTISDNFKEDIRRADQLKQAPEKSTIVTVGEVIGMIKMVLSSIIDAIDKSGKVGRDYLQANLNAMHKSADYKKIAAQDQAKGSFNAATIGIALTGVGMGASIASMGSHVNNANKMTKIQRAPIAEPSRNVGASINGKSVSLEDISREQLLAKNGGGSIQLEKSANQKNVYQDKVLHGKSDDATSYTSEAERERAFKIQQDLNKQSDKSAQLASTINGQTLPVGTIEEARKRDDAAKAQHASDIESSINESVRTLQGDNNNFYGALSGQLDKLGIVNIITQTIIAASQWK